MRLATLLPAVVLALLLAAPAQAEDIEVNLDHDDGNGTCQNGNCTLRDALSDAGPSDRVILPAGTYELQQGQLVLAGDTIVGAGARTTVIDGADEDRVIFTDRGTNSISGVTITGGSTFGGSPPTNVGGGILMAFNIEFPGASMTLTNVTVSDNAATEGGGIANFRTVTVVRSTITDNSASHPTSGGHGGGIWNAGGGTVLRNSTVSGNTASNGESAADGGGISMTGGSLLAESATLASNQAGFGSAILRDPQLPGTVTLSHTIVASGGDPFACIGVIQGANNVVDSASCGGTATDPLIGLLQNNGGQTDTHAIGAGSPAVNAGTTCDPTDQRGVARVGPCDIGAYESNLPGEVTVNVFTDDAPDGCTAAHCTLREKVDEAVGGEVIELDPGRYELTRGEPLLLDVNVTISGAGARAATIDANGLSRVGVVTAPDVDVTGVAVTGGVSRIDDAGPAPGNGGAFYVSDTGQLTVQQAALIDNAAFASGGAVANHGGLRFEESLAIGNVVEGNNPALGGAIYSVTQGLAELVNSTLSGNHAVPVGGAAARGGGLYVVGVTEVENVTITGNSATEGAGLYDLGGQSHIVGTLIADNDGPECGDPSTIGDVNESYNLADDLSCDFDGNGSMQGVDPRLAPLADNGGPTDTHALYTGSPALDGTDVEFCPETDQRLVTRPFGDCDIGAFEGSIAPPQNPPPPPPPPPPSGEEPQGGQQLPPPEAGESVNVVPSGTVRVRVPGSNRFRALEEGEQLPVGTVVDALKGRVTIFAAGGQSSVFYGGIFRIGQGKGAKPLTTLKLVEKLSCPKRGKASAAAKKKKRKRRLWGNGRGRFRTDGQYSAATVRGTKWLVEDRCTSTMTRVVKGRVSVRDKVKRKTVIVRAGKRYVAKRRG